MRHGSQPIVIFSPRLVMLPNLLVLYQMEHVLREWANLAPWEWLGNWWTSQVFAPLLWSPCKTRLLCIKSCARVHGRPKKLGVLELTSDKSTPPLQWLPLWIWSLLIKCYKYTWGTTINWSLLESHLERSFEVISSDTICLVLMTSY